MIFQEESSDKDTEPPCLCDVELDDETIVRALSSPLFIQERGESADRSQLSPFSHTQEPGDPCTNQVQICLKNGNQVATQRSNQDSP